MEALARLGKALRQVLRSRLFATAVLAVLSAGMISYVSMSMHAVTVFDGDVRHVVMTLSDNNTLVEKTESEPAAQPAEDSDLLTVQVTADGVTTIVRMAGGTVGDVLGKAGIEMDENDETNVATDTPASDGLSIQVARVEYKERTETETLSYKTVTQYTNTLAKGRVVWKQKGSEGRVTRVYRDRIVEGEVTDTFMVSEETIEPVDAIKLIGTVVGVPMSPAPFDIALDAAGQPLTYKSVLTGKATAYTNDRGLCGTTCSTGMKAQVGVVAVDPKIIPYGTKLYIVSADGSYVYGYAIAGDTGGGVRAGRIIADLFMDTYEECIQFGRRTMNVYILE